MGIFLTNYLNIHLSGVLIFREKFLVSNFVQDKLDPKLFLKMVDKTHLGVFDV